MIKQFKVRHTEVRRDYLEMYSEFQCDEQDLERVIEFMRAEYTESYIKERIPSFKYISQNSWDTYDSECDGSDDEIEEESEVEQKIKKNHLPGWF